MPRNGTSTVALRRAASPAPCSGGGKGGPRLALKRHQTLRAALDWSHGLLTQDEQTVFRRLGVFASSLSLESAQRVTADDRIDKWAALDHLGALVDKSLVGPTWARRRA